MEEVFPVSVMALSFNPKIQDLQTAIGNHKVPFASFLAIFIPLCSSSQVSVIINSIPYLNYRNIFAQISQW